jgi:GR25 family glycosyltransferase involved in LPS biosynthesis
MNTPIYVLTLENRLDRQESATKSLLELNTEFHFVFSSKRENVKFQAMERTTQIEVAIWGSHVRALQEMLKTNARWGLILEDDFVIKNSSVSVLKNSETIDSVLSNIENHYSILQIGFLENTYSNKRSYILGRFFKILFRYNRFDLMGYLKNLQHLGLKNSKEINKILAAGNFKRTKVLFGLRLGSHAYFINREAATALIDIFENREEVSNFMTIDQYLLFLTKNLSGTTFPKACRLSESIIAQSASPSDNINRTPTKVLETK